MGKFDSFNLNNAKWLSNQTLARLTLHFITIMTLFLACCLFMGGNSADDHESKQVSDGFGYFFFALGVFGTICALCTALQKRSIYI